MKNEHFFVSVDGQILLFCKWADREKREFFALNDRWGSRFNEDWRILCPADENREIYEGHEVEIHYGLIEADDPGRVNYSTKMQRAQKKLDALNLEKMGETQ